VNWLGSFDSSAATLHIRRHTMVRFLATSLAGALVALLLSVFCRDLLSRPLQSLGVLPHFRASFTVCQPRIVRLQIPSREFHDETNQPRPINTIAREVNEQKIPVVYRNHAFAKLGFSWPAMQRWNAEYFIHAAEAGAGPDEFLVKRSKSSVVQFANLRAERPFVRMKQHTGHGSDQKTAQERAEIRWPELPEWEIPFTSENMSVSSFFSELESSGRSRNSWLYFADGLSVLGPHLSRDVQPVGALCPGHSQAEVTEKCDMSIWVGVPGMTAWPHYDSSRNLFLQVKGRKKFVLAHPRAARFGLGLFPALSPMYRQAHSDLLDPDARFQPVFIPTGDPTADASGDRAEGGCATLTVWETILEPGDLLYIPPQWFHRVTSLPSPGSPPSEATFSVNSWWSASFTREQPSEFELLARVLKEPLAFESEWSPRQSAAAAAVYIRLIYAGVERLAMEEWARMINNDGSKKVMPRRPVSWLLNELLVTRFYPLFHAGYAEKMGAGKSGKSGVATDTSEQEPLTVDGPWCTAMRAKLSVAAAAMHRQHGKLQEERPALSACRATDLTYTELESMLPSSASMGTSTLSNSAAAPTELLKSRFGSYVERVMSHYAAVRNVELARLHVQNYVEEVAFYAVGGEVEQLYPYLACCVAKED
jgi:hypothetical protein